MLAGVVRAPPVLFHDWSAERVELAAHPAKQINCQKTLCRERWGSKIHAVLEDMNG
jgi:hypothetical protein